MPGGTNSRCEEAWAVGSAGGDRAGSVPVLGAGWVSWGLAALARTSVASRGGFLTHPGLQLVFLAGVTDGM